MKNNVFLYIYVIINKIDYTILASVLTRESMNYPYLISTYLAYIYKHIFINFLNTIVLYKFYINTAIMA